MTTAKDGVGAVPRHRTVRVPAANRVVLALLAGPFRRAVPGVCGLRFTGRRTGRQVVLPVEYAPSGDGVVILVGRSAGKSWWRNFRSPHAVEVLLDGGWRPAAGEVVELGDDRHAELLAAYRATHARVDAATAEPLVRITWDGPGRASTPPAATGLRAVWRSWLGWVTLGECAGFAVPSVVAAALVATGDGPAAVTLPALLAAGAVEGALLGLAQAHVLRRAVPGVPVRRYVAATSAGALLAWLIGLTPSTLGGRLTGVPVAVLVPVAAVLGAVLLLSIGTAQWTVLRRHLPRAGRWIWGTAVAWVAALGVFTAVTTPLWQPGQSPAVIAAIGVLGGVLMALTMAAVTGTVLVSLLRAARPNSADPAPA